MLVKEAEKYGKISTRVSKMPGTSYSIDSFACQTGSKLAAIKGTPCSVCYARTIQLLRPSCDKGWKDNLTAWLTSDPIKWVEAMAFMLKRYNTDGHHRWFASGDLQSLAMLEAIVEVCKKTPDIKHWLPTQERRYLLEYLKASDLPDNLVVRVSASRIDPLTNRSKSATVQKEHERFTHTSSVVTSGSHTCHANENDGKCGSCRKCWDFGVPHVSYPKHH